MSPATSPWARRPSTSRLIRSSRPDQVVVPRSSMSAGASGRAAAKSVTRSAMAGEATGAGPESCMPVTRASDHATAAGAGHPGGVRPAAHRTRAWAGERVGLPPPAGAGPDRRSGAGHPRAAPWSPTPRRAVRVLETSQPPAFYVPPADVAIEHLHPLPAPASHCEWKGAATYWSVQVGDSLAVDAAWSYEQPNTALRRHPGPSRVLRPDASTSAGWTTSRWRRTPARSTAAGSPRRWSGRSRVARARSAGDRRRDRSTSALRWRRGPGSGCRSAAPRDRASRSRSPRPVTAATTASRWPTTRAEIGRAGTSRRATSP